MKKTPFSAAQVRESRSEDKEEEEDLGKVTWLV